MRRDGNAKRREGFSAGSFPAIKYQRSCSYSSVFENRPLKVGLGIRWGAQGLSGNQAVGLEPGLGPDRAASQKPPATGRLGGPCARPQGENAFVYLT